MSRRADVIGDARACRWCEAHLPHEPRPVVRASAGARLLVIGQAQAFHLGADNGPAMAATVLAFRNHLFHRLPLPHPSWCNTGWLTRNPWFRLELLPALRERARALLQRPSR